MPLLSPLPALCVTFQSTPVIADERMFSEIGTRVHPRDVSIHARHC